MLRHDINFEITTGGYEIWFSDRIAADHPRLVEEFADWLEDEVGVVNLGQIEYRAVLADGVLTEEFKICVLAWWTDSVENLNLG